MYTNTYQLLPWDSDFFGFKVARIIPPSLTETELNNLLHTLKNKDIKLVYWFVKPQDPDANLAAKHQGGHLVDEKVTYVKSIDESSGEKDKHIMSFLHHSVTEKLQDLALQSGIYSRFKLDTHFKADTPERLYKIWLENSVKGEIATDVLVYIENGQEIGFITIGQKNGKGDIGLIAVDAKFRGKSIGRALMQAAEDKLSSLGLDQLQVVTQKANLGACSFYEKVGYRIERIENVYHFWL